MRAVRVSSSEPLVAGSLATWECRIVLRGAPVEAGGCVKIAYDLRGESGYNAFPQATDPAAANFASVSGPDGVELAPEGYRSHHNRPPDDSGRQLGDTESYDWRDLLGIYSSLNLHVLKITVVSGRLQAGDELRVTFGDSSGGSPGMTVPGQARPDWRHWVCVERTEGAPLELLGGDTVIVHPGPPERLVVVAPSIVTPEEEVPVAHVALDAFGNPVRRVRVQFPPAAREVGGNDDAGANPLDRIRIEDERLGLSGQSNPVEVVEEPRYRLYWGEIHGHTCLSDGGQRTPEQFYHWGRDTALLDFAAITDHDFGIALYDPQKHWAMVLDAARDFNESGRFVTLPGWEISHAGEVAGERYGHKNVYFLDDDPPFFTSSPYGGGRATLDYVHIEELVEMLECARVSFLLADHTSHMQTDWERFVPEYTRLVEVYSLFGCSEAKDVPVPTGAGRIPEQCTARAGLDRGRMLGFTAGTDTHMGAPAAYRETSFGHGKVPGLTAVWATELTRHAIFDALWHRRTYATRGERILLHTAVNGRMMGEELLLAEPDAAREVAIAVAGTAPLERIDLIHNGATLVSWDGGGNWELAVEYEHTEPMLGLATEPDLGYYYARVFQHGGGIAWSSPTWVIRPS